MKLLMQTVVNAIIVLFLIALAFFVMFIFGAPSGVEFSILATLAVVGIAWVIMRAIRKSSTAA